MAGSFTQAAFLRLCSPMHTGQSALFQIPAAQTTLIGRDPGCQIVLNADFGSVSRQHVRICPTPDGSAWQICDLNSTNGTYLNGRRLRNWQVLREGDRIALGRQGPQFVFELQIEKSSETHPLSTTTHSRTGDRAPFHPDAVTFSQLFPILSSENDLVRKAYLLPGMITVAFVVLMFISVGNSNLFNGLLASYISMGAYYFIYQLCGKRKPWWLLVGSALVTALLLLSPVLDLFVWFFQDVLPGEIPRDGYTGSLLMLLVKMLFGAGLMEELLKAIPVLLALAVGRVLRSPWRERIGVWEPLDGILLGTASAVGFTLVETLGQYVPSLIHDINMQAGQELGQVSGLQLLIARILGSIAGHLAYSGYFGYAIGLSVLKPAKRWQILATGYVTAAALHTLWNVSGMINLFALAAVGSLSYAFLTAAILKARQLSPNRSQNFATRISKLP